MLLNLFKQESKYSKINKVWKIRTDLLIFDFALFIPSYMFTWDLYLVLDQIYFRINSKIYEFFLQKDVFNFKDIHSNKQTHDKFKINNESFDLETIRSFTIFCFLFTKVY